MSLNIWGSILPCIFLLERVDRFWCKVEGLVSERGMDSESTVSGGKAGCMDTMACRWADVGKIGKLLSDCFCLLRPMEMSHTNWHLPSTSTKIKL